MEQEVIYIGPFGKWLPLPTVFSAVEKANKSSHFFDLLQKSKFSAKGEHITCSLCDEHCDHNATSHVKKGFLFTYGKFSEHFLTSQCHKQSEKAASTLENMRAAHLKRHGQPMEKPTFEKKGLLAMGFMKLSSGKYKETTDAARNATKYQSNTLGNHQATDPTNINEVSISEERQELPRALALRKNLSFKAQLLDLSANRCLGCLDWNDMTNEKLYLGLEYTSKYYEGRIFSPEYVFPMIPDTSAIHSIFSAKCTKVRE